MGKTFILKNWHLQCIGCRVVAFGCVQGHPTFYTGQRIHTSYITEKHTLEDGTICIETYVGNSYLLMPKEQNMKKELETKHSRVLLNQWLEKRKKNEKKRALL